MLKYILPLIPEHKTYIEPFAGGLAVFLAKNRCKVEVVNDYNREIANFYRYVKFHCASLTSGMGRVVNGVAHRVDRLKALGNGQVPEVVATAWPMLIKRLKGDVK